MADPTTAADPTSGAPDASAFDERSGPVGSVATGVGPTGAGALAPGAHSHGPRTADDQPPDARPRRVFSRDPEAFGVPSGREENWRFTPLERLRPLLNSLDKDGKVVLEVQPGPGVQVTAVGGGDPLVGSVLTPADRVSALAMAELDEAVLVSVPAGTKETTPTFLTIRGEGGTSYGHLIVDVAADASAVVVVDHVGSATLAANTELRIGDRASLTFVSLQNWDDDAVHAEAHAAVIGRDAKLRHALVTLGGDVVRITPTVRFSGPGGDAELLGLYFTDAGQHQEHRIYIDHNQSHCRSRVTYKGALQGEGAHAVWIGDVEIRPDTVGTDSNELNRNLLLSDGARADSVPNLEIETGEVIQASHASASGRFDDLQLFYLMARGIPADEARRLVVRGFFAEVIKTIGVPEIADRLIESVDEELSGVGA